MNDSDGTSASETESNGSVELSIVAEFDELMRLVRRQRNSHVEDSFIHCVEQMQLVFEELGKTRFECVRLREEIDRNTVNISDLECKLYQARKMIDTKTRRQRQVEEERDALQAQIRQVKQFLFSDHKYSDDVKHKLPFLNNSVPNWDPNAAPQLSAIPEVNTTGSLLSDFSYSRSEDDLDGSFLHTGQTWKKARTSNVHVAEPAAKKRRSSGNKVVEIANTDSIRATTTVTVPKHGAITATSVIESIPQVLNPVSIKQVRQHSLQTRIVISDTCGPCEKRIRFGKSALKCTDCRVVCHPECKDKLPLPCIQHVNTPTSNQPRLIGDYTPVTSPMVPALVVHCLNDIENRGLTEMGIYRIPGSEREVKLLKEKFLKGKGAPSLSQVDIHVVCGVVKSFLRSLQEPLTTFKLWPEFVQSVEESDGPASLYSTISKLPQPNRDTLAYMIVHLKKVAESKVCKMPISNLAKVFGPTIIGYSSNDPDPSKLIQESRQQNLVMEELLNISVNYWMEFLASVEKPAACLQQTPSTDSLMTPTRNIAYTPFSARTNRARKQKFFPTPPSRI